MPTNRASSSTSAAKGAVVLALAALLGAAVWAASPWLTGQKEPWDAEGFYYFGALALTGLGSGLALPRPLWAHYAGSVAGQLGYALLFLPVGPLLIVGAGFLLACSLLFLAGAALGSRLRVRREARAPVR